MRFSPLPNGENRVGFVLWNPDMKVVIQDEDTRLYLANQGRWTDSAVDAKDFAFSLHARSVARNLNLKRFQVLFYFPDLDYKIVVCDG
jgi:hypothetical protein